MKFVKKVLHRIAHKLHWNYGIADSYYEDGKLMMSFRCTGCGKRSGTHCVDKLVDNIK